VVLTITHHVETISDNITETEILPFGSKYRGFQILL